MAESERAESERSAAGGLAGHLAGYFARRGDVKPSTILGWRQVAANLLEFFGPDRPLSKITVGDARDFERWLKVGRARKHAYADSAVADPFARNTVRQRIKLAKQFLQDAVEHELLAKNPFAGFKGATASNRERDYFIDPTTAGKVLEACPGAQWRLLFALARWGGLRCPSEILGLCWSDVNWSESRLLVRSPKTEQHEGKADRVLPLFPELRPHLEVVWDQATAGADRVITGCEGSNLRTGLEKIIRLAGLVPWPKLWQNLRASRATELAAEYPAHVAAAWLGHSTQIASKHYWQVTESDFARATAQPTPPQAVPAAGGPISSSRTNWVSIIDTQGD